MSSVSTAFKVHYNQKLGGPIRPYWGGTHHGLWGDRRPWMKLCLHTLQWNCHAYVNTRGNLVKIVTVDVLHVRLTESHAAHQNLPQLIAPSV